MMRRGYLGKKPAVVKEELRAAKKARPLQRKGHVSSAEKLG